MAYKANYNCPNPKCKKQILAYIPDLDDVTKEKPYFDSSVLCQNCGKMHFKKSHICGIVETRNFTEKGLGKKKEQKAERI